jgi:MFS-type transporter involved in bile tolerance (Atg22 family)
MAFIIYGSRKTSIGIFEPPFYKCPNCGELHTTYIIVYSIYYHIFWIPVFPYQKDAIANCSACSFLRNEIKFGPNLIKEFEEKRKEYKHPWWAWSWVIIFLALILTIIIVAPK